MRSSGVVAERAQAQKCPLCGERVPAGEGLEALGKHFQRCPKTEATRRKDAANGAAAKSRPETE